MQVAQVDVINLQNIAYLEFCKIASRQSAAIEASSAGIVQE